MGTKKYSCCFIYFKFLHLLLETIIQFNAKIFAIDIDNIDHILIVALALE